MKMTNPFLKKTSLQMRNQMINEEIDEEEIPATPDEVTPPVFDEDNNHNSDVEVDSDEEDFEPLDESESFRPHNAPRTVRGRRGKKVYKTKGYVPLEHGKKRRELLPWEDKNLEYDEWCNAFYWGKDASLKFQITRLAPERDNRGQNISGILETRHGAFMQAEEVRSAYGGGIFSVVIYGLHPHADDTKPRILSRRRLTLPGPPNTMDSALPKHILSARGGVGADPLASTAMNLVKSELENLRRGQTDNPRLVEKTLATMRDVSEQRAKFAEKSAEDRIMLVRQQLDEERKERLSLLDRLRNTESEMTKKSIENQERMSKAVKDAQDSSMSILTQLLPTLTGNASEQVRQIALMHQAREERQAAENKMMLQQAQDNARTQLESSKALFMAQMESQKSQYENVITLLRGELQIARAEVQTLRSALDTKTQELIARSMEQQKSKSPMEQMAEMGTMFEAMDSIKNYFGGGSDEKSPMDRVLGTLEGLASNAPAFLQAWKQGQQQQPIPQQLPMPRLAPSQAPQQSTQALVPVLPQVIPNKVKKSGIKKSDIASALKFIENVLNTGNNSPPNPEAVAMSAISQVDNNVLRNLASRDPEKVIAQLQNNDMLSGVLLEDRGKQYLIGILTELKKRFS